MASAPGVLLLTTPGPWVPRAAAALARRIGRVHGAVAGAWLLALMLTLAAALARAATPPAEPVLRVEAGMHVNLVRAIAVDAVGRWAVTAADDKTARVWDIVNNAAGPVLRVPIDGEAEGRLQAVVITPDGGTVAVGGNTGRAWDGSNAVVVFDRASGALLRRIDTRSALPIETLALSRDGRLLAVGLAGSGGLRLFDFTTGALLAQDGDYAETIYALDFRGDGRLLVAGGADGRLRVYDVSARQLQMAGGGRPQGGRLIAQARYSPDGQLLALAFEDSPQVQVLSAADLGTVALPGVGDAAAGAFSSLAWSPDGGELWGGGAHRDGDRWLLRVWPRANFASYADRPAAGASVLAITTLPGQRVAYASAEPGWGVVDRTAAVQRRSQSPVANFNSLARQFQLSADGRRVRFWYAYKQPPFAFDLASRSLQPDAGAANASGWLPPRLTAPGLDVGNWENSRGTLLNGVPLPLGALETARSLAIAADGRSFALGSDERLWRFDAGGRPLWSRRTPAVVWAVNQTADGRTIVTAGQDGAVRWYRADDGRELMALLLHADQRRWVLWTPSGYFDAAVGAEDLLGWHVNRGAGARPDFFPLRTLRARLYRPDVVDRVLDTGDEAEALKLANAAGGGGRRDDAPLQSLATSLPPVLELAGAVDVVGQAPRRAALRVRLRTAPDAPVTEMRVRVDGRPAESVAVKTLNDTADGELRELSVQFAGEPRLLQVMAANRHGLSAPVAVALAWPGAVPLVSPLVSPPGSPVVAPVVAPVAASPVLVPPAPSAAPPAAAPLPPQAPATVTAQVQVQVQMQVQVQQPPPSAQAAAAAAAANKPAPPAGDFKIQPKLYILAIGVGSFVSNDVPPLDLTGKDVRDFVAEMKKQQGALYRGVETRVLIDQTATRDNIVDGLEWLQKQVTQHDVGMLFVSGHGDNDAELGYIYVPYNFDFEAKRRTAVNMKDFQKTLDSLAGKALFFIDTCHSGNVIGGRTRSLGRNSDVSGVINELMSAESGVVVFSASTGRQKALEDKAWGNGAFTKAVVEGLQGKADFRSSGRVTHKMLDLYITERVKELTKGAQSPVTQAPGGVPDFPLAAVR